MSPIRRLAAVLLPVTLALGSLPARADVVTTFDFSGPCSDCTGSGNAELVLNNYTLGTTIMSDNFVSFHYDGTNLLAPFSISSSDMFFVGGSIGPTLPGPQNVQIFNSDEGFQSSTSGYWCVGGSCLADYGSAHEWTLVDGTATIPEPMTLSLLGGGLLGLAALKRRG